MKGAAIHASSKITSLQLNPFDNQRLSNLCGPCDEHLRLVEQYLAVKINNRGHLFQIIGHAHVAHVAKQVLIILYEETAHSSAILTPDKIHLVIQTQLADATQKVELSMNNQSSVMVQTKQGNIKARSKKQQDYLQNIEHHAINFAIGPAGTGKTYLAVASAVHALQTKQSQRLILVRPVVEAGERLGFLPGDLTQKVDPYFRPLYDALFDMLGATQVQRLLEQNIIEIAPLAYMRGRTLNDAFIILDESQNTTREQMKMFLTRIGFGAKAIITGDLTQIDLPSRQESGLSHALKVLQQVEGISFNYFSVHDIVRHPLVQAVVTAYEAYENQSR